MFYWFVDEMVSQSQYFGEKKVFYSLCSDTILYHIKRKYMIACWFRLDRLQVIWQSEPSRSCKGLLFPCEFCNWECKTKDGFA